MTEQQKSRQASRNANAKRNVWQRAAIANGALAMERLVEIDKMGAEIIRLMTAQRTRTDQLGETQEALDDSRRCCLMADARANLWRLRYIEAVDADVQRMANEQAAKDEPMPY